MTVGPDRRRPKYSAWNHSVESQQIHDEKNPSPSLASAETAHSPGPISSIINNTIIYLFIYVSAHRMRSVTIK